MIAYTTTARPTVWTTPDIVEQIAASRPGEYVIEFGSDEFGDYGAVVTREGTTFAAGLGAVR